MRIALFDRINETHVCTSLEEALRHRGHSVLSTGPIWHGHRFAITGHDIEYTDAALDAVLAEGCDWLLNFRASALTPAQVRRIRSTGVASAVWLPDDPVLYATTYRHVVDGYDHVLNCGPASVLQFYDGRGHRQGVNFPFWLDPYKWHADWSIARADKDLVFLGNALGKVREGRYAAMAPAKRRIAVYGKCVEDPHEIHRGELFGVEAMRAVLPGYAAGLNIPQRFADYAGTSYDFSGLADLGEFFLPSRVTQYAALGLPVISLGAEAVNPHFPHALRAGDIAAALRVVDRLRSDPALSAEVSADARKDVLQSFSAAARAHLLEALFSGELDPRTMGLHEREYAYRNYRGSYVVGNQPHN